jgi:hypothetical protein
MSIRKGCEWDTEKGEMLLTEVTDRDSQERNEKRRGYLRLFREHAWQRFVGRRPPFN